MNESVAWILPEARTTAYIAYMDERRSNPRIPVSVTLSQHIEGETHHCTVTDLSTDGLYMERPMGSFLRRSAQVQLEIPLPDADDAIWASAEIVYDCFDSHNHGTAVRFTAMTDRDRTRLSSFLRSSAGTVAHQAA